MKYSVKSFADKRKIYILHIIATLLLFAAVAIGVLSGSSDIALNDVINAFFNGAESTVGKIIIYVRLPRVLGAVFAGSALSVSGMIIQNVLFNKLASPSIIGINSGAGFAVTLCSVCGIFGGFELSFCAFLGALTVALTICTVSKKLGASKTTVILLGVAVNSLMNALSDAIITFAPDIVSISRDFKIGDFSSVTYEKLLPSVVLITATITVLATLTNSLDVLSLGEENAFGLGLNASKMRMIFLLCAAVLSGCAVSIAGLVSFIGLIVPHTLRRLGVNKPAHLLPLCALFGGAFTLICDTLARTLFSPYEIPVGIIMAFIGVPFFIFLLIKSKGGRTDA